jgi:hypothetical protein
VPLITGIHQCGLVQERIANDVLSLARVQLDMLTFYDVDMNLRQQTQKVGHGPAVTVGWWARSCRAHDDSDSESRSSLSLGPK